MRTEQDIRRRQLTLKRVMIAVDRKRKDTKRKVIGIYSLCWDVGSVISHSCFCLCGSSYSNSHKLEKTQWNISGANVSSEQPERVREDACLSMNLMWLAIMPTHNVSIRWGVIELPVRLGLLWRESGEQKLYFRYRENVSIRWAEKILTHFS